MLQLWNRLELARGWSRAEDVFLTVYLSSLLGQYLVASAGTWIFPLKVYMLTRHEEDRSSINGDTEWTVEEDAPLLAQAALDRLRAYASGHNQYPSAEDSAGKGRILFLAINHSFTSL